MPGDYGQISSPLCRLIKEAAQKKGDRCSRAEPVFITKEVHILLLESHPHFSLSSRASLAMPPQTQELLLPYEHLQVKRLTNHVETHQTEAGKPPVSSAGIKQEKDGRPVVR